MNKTDAIKSFLYDWQMRRLFVDHGQKTIFINVYSHIRPVMYTDEIGLVFRARFRMSLEKKAGTIKISPFFFNTEVMTLSKMRQRNQEDLSNRLLLAEPRVKIDSVMKFLKDAKEYAKKEPSYRW